MTDNATYMTLLSFQDSLAYAVRNPTFRSASCGAEISCPFGTFDCLTILKADNRGKEMVCDGDRSPAGTGYFRSTWGEAECGVYGLPAQ
ncbi:hypothetical protein Barb6XT_01918 [Bacteroidales bacterium Barb6XT]|nr:hypothetical protein Barb6XT_01918 [Bacteroidales bacterium Barb6XT]